MSSDPKWEGFSLRCMELRADAGFQVTDLTSRVIAEPGPVLFFRQTQSRPRELAQDKLEDCTVTSITNPASKTDMLADLKALRDRFVGGGAERFLPRRLVDDHLDRSQAPQWQVLGRQSQQGIPQE